jgi:hypothetical protein
MVQADIGFHERILVNGVIGSFTGMRHACTPGVPKNWRGYLYTSSRQLSKPVVRHLKVKCHENQGHGQSDAQNEKNIEKNEKMN